MLPTTSWSSIVGEGGWSEWLGQRITAVALSPDGNRVASGDSGRDIKVWEIGRSEPLVTVPLMRSNEA